MAKNPRGLVFVITKNLPNIEGIDNALIHTQRVNANTLGPAGEWVRDIYGERSQKNTVRSVLIRTKYGPETLFKKISEEYGAKLGAEIEGMAVSLSIDPEESERLFDDLIVNPNKYLI